MKKSDTQLQQDVLAELKWEPSINAAQIGVEVKDGIVTLAGHVNTYAEKCNAERATQRVAGVKALAVEMDVKIEGMNNRTDGDIARSVENVLQFTTYLAKDGIKVKVEKEKAPDAPVFETISRINVSRQMRAACVKATIDPPAVFRDLRRSYGSLPLNSRAPADAVAPICGSEHSSKTP